MLPGPPGLWWAPAASPTGTYSSCLAQQAKHPAKLTPISLPFCSLGNWHKEHNYFVRMLGSGNFSNLSGEFFLSPFTSLPPQQEKTLHLESFRCRCVKTLVATSHLGD